jgi:hypothetical protein
VVPSEITGLPAIPFDNQPMNSAGPAPRESAERLPVSRRRIAVNFLTLAGTNVFGLLVTILISVYVRRAMGPEAIGQVSWAMAAIAYLTALFSPSRNGRAIRVVLVSECAKWERAVKDSGATVD